MSVLQTARFLLILALTTPFSVGVACLIPMEKPRSRSTQYAALELRAVLNDPVNLPQFIIDLDHAWLKNPQSRAYLDSLPDPVEALCSLSSTIRPKPNDDTSSVHHYPQDLYKKLIVENNQRRHETRKNWKIARTLLPEILSCPAALQDVETLEVGIYIQPVGYASPTPEPSAAPADVSELFALALSQMPKLQELNWQTWKHGNEEFGATFRQSGLRLHNVKTLNTPDFRSWWIDVCPNVEKLWISSLLSPEDMGKLPNLSSLNLGADIDCTLEFLDNLAIAAPQLQEIRFPNLVSPDGSSYQGSVSNLLQTYAATLSKFKHLRVLTLPPLERLHLGFYGWPWCGNAYYGREGRQMERDLHKSEAETIQKAGEIVLDKIPWLETLSVEGYSVSVQTEESSNGNGMSERKASIKWPWTDIGIEEYVNKTVKPYTDADEKWERELGLL